MKTLVFDIDGTLTDMWPLERAVLSALFQKRIDELKSSGWHDTYKMFRSAPRMSKAEYLARYNSTFSLLLRSKMLPTLKRYPVVRWIVSNRRRYHFVYATGGQKSETRYVLDSLGLIDIFDLKNSLDKSSCAYPKHTGIPLRRIKVKCGDCILITDSPKDRKGAGLAKMPCKLIRPGQRIPRWFV
jgi:phosphoglycolate phosphatase-like HAD superfamily hydrolase